MSGVEIRIKMDDQAVRSGLEALSRRMTDMTPVMRSIGEIVRTSVIRNFREEREPSGVRWKPSLRALLTGGKTLTDTGILRNSINVRPGPQQVSIGTNIVYAAIHQFGGKAGRGHKVKLPARPFLGVRDSDWMDIKETIADYLTGGGKNMA